MFQAENKHSTERQKLDHKPKDKNNKTTFQFNIDDKGKAFVNRHSWAIRREKYRQPSRPLFSESATIHTLPSDVSPNAFSFGFDFGDILNNKRE